MNRGIASAFALALSVISLSLASPDSTARAQPRRPLGAHGQMTESTQGGSAQRGAAGRPRSAGQARRRRRGRGAAASATTPTQGPQSQAGTSKVTVLRRLNQARLSAAAIKSVRSISLLRRIVAVRGNTIRPLDGSSLWQLSNGSYVVVGGGTDKPEVYASEVYTHDTPAGLMVWACYCPGYDANKDDGCKFDGSTSPVSCKQMGGVNCSCKFEDFLIMSDGSVLGFEGPGGGER